ncbi:ankyrin repeat-containing protein [Anaeramoeba ignava]|uniref:Ankyrin repeat-containing protein n=1 Tax=Anaeramoeba ignava TaxID=1746090 RepID=A0A9Q0LGY1_ANAIG|nr:ankyrin repeat-containing protein [Anaeramoeba ignava]
MDQTRIEEIINFDNEEELNELIKNKSIKFPKDSYLINQAIQKDKPKCFHSLLEVAEIELNFIDQKTNLSPLSLSIITKKQSFFQDLLTKGADPNFPNEKGRTPLMFACLIGAKSFVEALLRNKINLSLKDRHGFTNVHMAVLASSGTTNSLDMLYSKNASLNEKDNQNRTPLHLAAYLGKFRANGFQVNLEETI